MRLGLVGSSVGSGISAAGESITIASSSAAGVEGVDVALAAALPFFLGGMIASQLFVAIC